MTPSARRRPTWETSRERSSADPSPADVPEAPEGAVCETAPEETAAPIRVQLLWPDKGLSPNARIHWAKRAGLVKRARRDAAVIARATGLRKIDADALDVAIIFCPPDNRHRDRDNMLSSLKPAIDGLADVIGVDDSRWEIAIRKAEPRPPHGAVIVEIEVPA